MEPPVESANGPRYIATTSNTDLGQFRTISFVVSPEASPARPSTDPRSTWPASFSRRFLSSNRKPTRHVNRRETVEMPRRGIGERSEICRQVVDLLLREDETSERSRPRRQDVGRVGQQCTSQ
jgi:hypothetical protein